MLKVADNHFNILPIQTTQSLSLIGFNYLLYQMLLNNRTAPTFPYQCIQTFVFLKSKYCIRGLDGVVKLEVFSAKLDRVIHDITYDITVLNIK